MQQATECKNCIFKQYSCKAFVLDAPRHPKLQCGVMTHSRAPHLSRGVLDGVLVEDAGNAGVRQALLDNLLELVALVGLEDDAAASQARGDARHQPLRQVERVGDADDGQPRPGARRPLAQVVQHLRVCYHGFRRRGL
jgi:hypothetical protein